MISEALCGLEFKKNRYTHIMNMYTNSHVSRINYILKNILLWILI